MIAKRTRLLRLFPTALILLALSSAPAARASECGPGATDRLGRISFNHLIGPASQGDVEAQLALGLSYHRLGNWGWHWGIQNDRRRAEYWLGQADRQGSLPARHYLACLFLTRRIQFRDHPRAVRMLRDLADQGLGRSQAAMALLTYAGVGTPRDREASSAWEQRAIASRDPEALYNLGDAYFFGRGLEMDRDRGWALLLASAGLGHGPAQAEVGIQLYAGENRPRDREAAIAWWRRAVGAGSFRARVYLAEELLGGDALAGDLPEAHRLLFEAADGGLLDIQLQLAEDYLAGRRGWPRNRDWAFYWMRRVAENGHPLGQLLLAKALSAGLLPGSPDPEGAFHWMSRAASSGILPEAARRAGYWALEGVGAKPDGQRGRQWLAQAFEAGDDLAGYLLAGAYYTGHTALEKNWPQARAWAERAARRGELNAAGLLGVMMIRGEGGPLDWAAGLDWLEKAVEGGQGMSKCILADLAFSALPDSPGGPLPDSPYGAEEARAMLAEGVEADAPGCWDYLAAYRLFGLHGFEKSPDQARRIYQRQAVFEDEGQDTASAARGDAGAAIRLGLLLGGIGPMEPESADEAAMAPWLHRAWESNPRMGALPLAILYAGGLGVGRDLARAESLFEQARGAGLGEAYPGVFGYWEAHREDAFDPWRALRLYEATLNLPYYRMVDPGGEKFGFDWSDPALFPPPAAEESP